MFKAEREVLCGCRPWQAAATRVATRARRARRPRSQSEPLIPRGEAGSPANDGRRGALHGAWDSKEWQLREKKRGRGQGALNKPGVAQRSRNRTAVAQRRPEDLASERSEAKRSKGRSAVNRWGAIWEIAG